MGRRAAGTILIALILVVLGVCMSTVHEVRGMAGSTVLGVGLTFLGVILTTGKGIATNKLLVGPLGMSPLQVLAMMAVPCVLQCCLFALYYGELELSKLGEIPAATLLHLTASGFLAFTLNYVSFSANAALGPLALAVAANVKQIIMVALAMTLFDKQRGKATLLQLRWHSNHNDRWSMV